MNVSFPIRLMTGLCLILLASACTESGNVSTDENRAHIKISIHPEKASGIRYSTLFSEINYIPVPTSNDFIIGSVDKLIHSDSLVFIMDKTITQSVFIFNTYTGQHLQVNKLGAAPDEYISMRDIFYDAPTGEWAVFCKMNKRIIYFTPQGESVRVEKIPFYMERVSPLPSGYALFSEYTFNPELKKHDQSPDLVLTSEDKVVSSAYPFKKDINKAIVWTTQPGFSQVTTHTYSIKPDHNNIIYHIGPDSIYPAFLLDFGSYNLDSRYWKETEKYGATLERVNDFCNYYGFCESYNTLEDEDYLFFNYKQKDKIHYAFYSKKTGKLINASSIENDMDYITPFYPVLLQDHKIYCLLNPDDVIMAKTFLKEEKLIPSVLLNEVREFDNPVIAIFTLKEF